MGIVSCLFTSTAHAMSPYEQPILYSRAEMVVVPHTLPDQPAPPGIRFDIEVRPAGSLFNSGWFQFTSYPDNRGLLLIYSTPQYVTIDQQQYFSPLDIWLVDDYGAIIQILPSITLSGLNEPITSVKPIIATFYTKPGSAESLGIVPGDAIEYKLFKKHPVILDKENASRETPASAKEQSTDEPGKETDENKDGEPGIDLKRRTKPIHNPPDPDLVDKLLKRHYQE